MPTIPIPDGQASRGGGAALSPMLPTSERMSRRPLSRLRRPLLPALRPPRGVCRTACSAWRRLNGGVAHVCQPDPNEILSLPSALPPSFQEGAVAATAWGAPAQCLFRSAMRGRHGEWRTCGFPSTARRLLRGAVPGVWRSAKAYVAC